MNQLFNLFDYGFIFFTFRLVNAVIHILTGYRAVGRNHYYIQFVDVPQLTGFCFGRTGHTREFVVHAEVVLQRDGSKCLCGSFHFHTFFGFDGLVQSVRVTAAFHDTSCLLVNNLHLSVDHYIFIVFLKHGICLQQLVDGVYAF